MAAHRAVTCLCRFEWKEKLVFKKGEKKVKPSISSSMFITNNWKETKDNRVLLIKLTHFAVMIVSATEMTKIVELTKIIENVKGKQIHI